MTKINKEKYIAKYNNLINSSVHKFNYPLHMSDDVKQEAYISLLTSYDKIDFTKSEGEIYNYLERTIRYHLINFLNRGKQPKTSEYNDIETVSNETNEIDLMIIDVCVGEDDNVVEALNLYLKGGETYQYIEKTLGVDRKLIQEKLKQLQEVINGGK